MLDISNYYEKLVGDQLRKMAKDSPETMSHGFIQDVACLALNKLPSCYIRNPIDKGWHLTESAYFDMSAQVEQALAEAVEQVRRQPHDVREA